MEKTYLGNGVYASFDGYQIWLAVNHHTNTVVALEPNMFNALVEFEKRPRRAARDKESQP